MGIVIKQREACEVFSVRTDDVDWKIIHHPPRHEDAFELYRVENEDWRAPAHIWRQYFISALSDSL